jgi:hypothetical protein
VTGVERTSGIDRLGVPLAATEGKR